MDNDEDMDVNYELSLKSPSGEIMVYVIEQELVENYENKILELRLQEEAKGIKRDKTEEDRKEDVKPNKRKVGR